MMKVKKRYFKFWLSVLEALETHGDAFNHINEGGIILVFYDQAKGKYVLYEKEK